MNNDMFFVNKMFESLGYNLKEYKIEPEEDIVCILCEGQHGNNSQCQRND